MLKTEITHPELLQALAEAGHGAKILLADSNYAVTANSNPAARIVYLNLKAGTVGGIEILRALANIIPIESALYINPPSNTMPAIVQEYKTILGDVPLQGRERFAFYDEAKSDDTTLVIASGEARIYACLLMTVGVVC